MMFKPTHRAPAPWFKSTTRPQDITLAIIITIMSLTTCNKVGEKMPSTTFINDAQKCSKNIITCKELSEDLICSVLQRLRFHPWVRSRSLELLVDLLKAPGQTEFNSLVRILTDNDLAGGTQGSTDQVKVGIL